MIKVLVLVANLSITNGISSFVMNYFRNLDHQRVKIDIAQYYDAASPYYDEIRRAGGQIFLLPGIKNMPGHMKMCREILQQGQYDIVHDNILLPSIPMMACAKACHVPVRILHSHNSRLGETRLKESRNRFFLPFLRWQATNYLACSKLAGQAMFGTRPYKVIPNVISSHQFVFDPQKRNQVRRENGVESKPVVGVVGRLAKQKNPFFAMDVFQALLKRLPDAELWWIGSGPLEREVKKYTELQGLGEAVKFFGNRDDVRDLYQAMDVLLMPSLFEGLPLTGVEAQAMGLPVVASDTITTEMVYTDLVHFMGLQEPADRWAEQLDTEIHRKTERKNYAEWLDRSGYTDQGCGVRLLDLYEAMLQKR